MIDPLPSWWAKATAGPGECRLWAQYSPSVLLSVILNTAGRYLSVRGDMRPWATPGVGRVEMWRGGFSSIGCGRCSGWRRHPCDRTFTPFPHPAQRTGRADFPHPALGQDTCLRTRKVIRKSLIYNGERGSPQYPDQAINRSLQMPPLRRSFALRVNSDSYFTSASATFCSARSLAELTRVAPISRALPRSVPVLT